MSAAAAMAGGAAGGAAARAPPDRATTANKAGNVAALPDFGVAPLPWLPSKVRPSIGAQCCASSGLPDASGGGAWVTQWLVMAGCLALYFVAMAGVVFDLHTGADAVGQAVTTTGRLRPAVFRVGDVHAQWVVEGLAGGALFVLGGAGLILFDLAEDPKRVRAAATTQCRKPCTLATSLLASPLATTGPQDAHATARGWRGALRWLLQHMHGVSACQTSRLPSMKRAPPPPSPNPHEITRHHHEASNGM
eukprot:SAG25_NODE_1172_length_3701_cov_1.416435_1_plen_249_part_00